MGGVLQPPQVTTARFASGLAACTCSAAPRTFSRLLSL